MMSFTLPLLGLAEFPAESAPDWWFDAASPLGPIKIDFHTKSGQIIDAVLPTAVPLLCDLAALDATARRAIRADYATDDSARSFHFLEYHLEEYSADELTTCFGIGVPEQIGVEQLLAALRLKRVGFYWDKDDDYAVLDYVLADMKSDQIIVVYADLKGTVTSVQMES